MESSHRRDKNSGLSAAEVTGWRTPDESVDIKILPKYSK